MAKDSQPRYGGQAVIEGVMMSGPQGKAIAVRTENGEIIYKIEDAHAPSEKYPWLGWPIIRGVVNFARSFVNGIKDLTWSAAQAGESEDDKLTGWQIAGAVIMALIFAVVVFIVIPVFLGTWVRPYVGDFGRSLFEGILRGAMFLGYVLAIGRMDDIKRVFSYHGAEHKTINAFEAGAPLTPQAVSEYSRIHVRCGTSFILMAMLLMIIIFTFVGQTTPLLRIVIKLLLMPLIAGLAYELFRLPLLFPNSRIVKILVAPGLAMQRLTTREPDPDQIEVAIAALKAVPGFADIAIRQKTIQQKIQRSLTEEQSRPDLGETIVFNPSDSSAQMTEPTSDNDNIINEFKNLLQHNAEEDPDKTFGNDPETETAVAVAANVEEVIEPEYEPHGATLGEKIQGATASAAAVLSSAVRKVGFALKKAGNSIVRTSKEKVVPWCAQTAKSIGNRTTHTAEGTKKKITALKEQKQSNAKPPHCDEPTVEQPETLSNQQNE